MNKVLFTIAAVVAIGLAGCQAESETANKSVEELKPSSTPSRIQQTPESVDPADVVTADTTKQGATLFANEDNGKKTLNCKEYNRVMVNGSGNEVSITGVCSQITVNGHRNKLAAVAAAEIITYGTQNEVTYSKLANGKKPVVTDTSGSNTVTKAAAVPVPTPKK